MDINATIIGQSIAFIVFILFCMKYIWPPIIQAINERQEKIAEGLAASEKGSQDLEIAQQKASEILKEAKAEAATLVEQAKKRHSEVVDAAKDDARVEAEKIKIAAQAEIEQEVNRAKEALRGQIAVLTVAGAEKILERSIDSSSHTDIIDKLVAEI